MMNVAGLWPVPITHHSSFITQTLINAASLPQSFSSKVLVLSTMTLPASLVLMASRSSGVLAGPLVGLPSWVNLLPWQGQVSTASLTLIVHFLCEQMALGA